MGQLRNSWCLLSWAGGRFILSWVLGSSGEDLWRPSRVLGGRTGEKSWWSSPRGLSHVYVCVCASCSVMSDSVAPWTVAHQAPLSMGFSRQEYWSGLPFLSPRDLPDPEIGPRSSALQADSLPSEPPRKPNPTWGMGIPPPATCRLPVSPQGETNRG